MPELPISTEGSDTVPIVNNGISVDKDSDHDNNSMQTTVPVQHSVDEFGKHVTCCILKLHIVPTSVVQDFIDEMNFMVSHVHETHKSVYRSVFEQHNISLLNEGLSNVLLCDASVYSSVFDGTDTDYKLKNTICSNF